MADSDVVWDGYIPPDHRKHVVDCLNDYISDSRKEVYIFLCTYVAESLDILW